MLWLFDHSFKILLHEFPLEELIGIVNSLILEKLQPTKPFVFWDSLYEIFINALL